MSRSKPRRPLGDGDAGIPDPVDSVVGVRIRLRRGMLGLSQNGLAESLGLTCEQIQDYERGAIRVGAFELYRFSQALDVPLWFFFEDAAPVRASDGDVLISADNLLEREEVPELLDAFDVITDPFERRHLLLSLNKLADGTLP